MTKPIAHQQPQFSAPLGSTSTKLERQLLSQTDCEDDVNISIRANAQLAKFCADLKKIQAIQKWDNLSAH